MPRFLIERHIPAAGALTENQVQQMAETSNEAVDSLGVPYAWVTSYVTGDRIYCVHDADDADAVIEHARRCGFPADAVSVVVHQFGPDSAPRPAGAERRAETRD